MKITTYMASIIVAVVFMLNGCATYNAKEVGPTSIFQAQEEIPEEELLDVGITHRRGGQGGGHPSRCQKGRATFHPLSPEKHVTAK